MESENVDEIFDTVVVDFKSFPYRMREVARILSHPKVNGRTKLFKFLNQQGVFEGTEPNQFYVDLGYFSVDGYYTKNGWYANVTSISAKGVNFIKELVQKELVGHETLAKKNRRTKPECPTTKIPLS